MARLTRNARCHKEVTDEITSGQSIRAGCGGVSRASIAAGTDLGNDLWRMGIALELVDLVIMKLWPTARAA